jgi:hypothetical protein
MISYYFLTQKNKPYFSSFSSRFAYIFNEENLQNLIEFL